MGREREALKTRKIYEENEKNEAYIGVEDKVRKNNYTSQ